MNGLPCSYTALRFHLVLKTAILNFHTYFLSEDLIPTILNGFSSLIPIFYTVSVEEYDKKLFFDSMKTIYVVFWH